MTEKPPKFESAEDTFLIDPESGYFRALDFVTNPVGYFSNYYQDLVDNGFLKETFGLQAIPEMSELEEIICNEDIPVENEQDKLMLESAYGSKEWPQQFLES